MCVVSVVLISTLSTGCKAEPKVSESFPDPRPWFTVEQVDIEGGGLVEVQGSLVASALAGMTAGASAGGEDAQPFPDHVAYGFWPDPTEVGPGDVVDVQPSGSFVFAYDFSRSDGARAGWHVLQFDKAEWGSQLLWLNIRKGEWSEIEP